MYGQGAQEALALGQLGSDLIRDTGVYTAASHSGPNRNGWGIIEAMADTVFTTLTSNVYPQNPVDIAAGKAGTAIFIPRPNLTAFTLVRGSRIYGAFTAITLASGAVMAYRL